LAARSGRSLWSSSLGPTVRPLEADRPGELGLVTPLSSAPLGPGIFVPRSCAPSAASPWVTACAARVLPLLPLPLPPPLPLLSATARSMLSCVSTAEGAGPVVHSQVSTLPQVSMVHLFRPADPADPAPATQIGNARRAQWG